MGLGNMVGIKRGKSHMWEDAEELGVRGRE